MRFPFVPMQVYGFRGETCRVSANVGLLLQQQHSSEKLPEKQENWDDVASNTARTQRFNNPTASVRDPETAVQFDAIIRFR